MAQPERTSRRSRGKSRHASEPLLLDGRTPLPLVVSPHPGERVTDVVTLTRWVAEHRELVERQLLEHGGILYRGFRFDSAEAFEKFAMAIAPKPMDYVGGETPRRHVAGWVYTSTEVHRALPILLHCEMSYLNRYPARVLLFCQTPATKGGQTPIADMRRVYQDLDPVVRQRFEEKGLRQIRNFPGRRNFLRLKTWQEVFQTDDRATVETLCRDQGAEFAWRPDGSLRLIRSYPASITHPWTGERVWFNQVNVFHASGSWELRRLNRKVMAALLAYVETRWQRTLAPEEYRSQCTFGDGSAIPRHDVLHVRQVLWDHAVVFDWQPGDVLLLDNLAVAHARLPYRGSRRVLALLAAPVLRASPSSGSR